MFKFVQETHKCFHVCMFLGDTGALCDDMKDFAHDYIDYCNMAKQLIPETNTVQHWSKIIETKYVLYVLAGTWISSLFLQGILD